MGIYYELRKLVLRKSTMFLLCTLLCINAGTILIQYCNSGGGFDNGVITPYNSSKKEWEYYLQLCEKYHGELTVEKITELKEEYNQAERKVKDGTYSREYDESANTGYVYRDYSMISDYFFEPIKGIVNYSEDMKTIEKKLKENIEYYKQYDNVFFQEKNVYMKEKYENRCLNIFYDTYRLEEFINYHISDIFVFFILMITVLPTFFLEKQNEMEELLEASGMGKKCIYVDKYLASGIWILGVVCFFLFENMLLFLSIYKVQGFHVPIYFLPSFRLSGLDLKIWQYLLLSGFCKILSFEILGLVFLVISQKIYKQYAAYVVAVLVTTVFLYLAGFFATNETFYTWLYLFSPLSLLDIGNVYERIYSVDLFGHFVERGNLCIFIWGTIFIMFCLQKGGLLWYWQKRKKKKVFLYQK